MPSAMELQNEVEATESDSPGNRMGNPPRAREQLLRGERFLCQIAFSIASPTLVW